MPTAVLRMLLSLLLALPALPPAVAAAPARQAVPDTAAEELFSAVLSELPAPPALIRLARIVLEPGARVPLHTHPGPEFGRIERGTVTVRVDGDAVVALAPAAGTPSVARVPAAGQPFTLAVGDQIAYPAGVPFTFANESTVPVTVLTVAVLPVGADRPPASAWVDRTPTSDAMAGVTSQVLGDAIASGWPEAPILVRLERLALAPGEAIPAVTGPVMLSVELGRLEFALVDGEFQVSFGAEGPQANATPGAVYRLDGLPDDGGNAAIFFPGGMNRVERSQRDGVLVLLRLSFVAFDATALPPSPTADATAAAATPAGAIRTTASEAGEGPRAPAGSTAEANATATAPPAGEQRARITAEGVRVRAVPSTEGAVVAGLALGQVVIVTGPAVDAEGLRWVPIALADDPTVAGYVAEQFLTAAS